MRNLKDIVKRAHEGPALMFRAHAYDLANPDDFLADISALANADIVGQRALIVGVSPGEPGQRKVRGFPRQQIPDASTVCALIEKFIEPALSVQVLAPGASDKSLCVILLDHCDAPPYVMKRSCGVLLKGAGFIRRDSRNHPLGRQESARLSARAEAGQEAERPIAAAAPEPGNVPLVLAFPGGQRTFSVMAAASDSLPSAMASVKLKEALKARKEVQAMSGLDTGIVRLMHVRAFGPEQPFAKKSIEELEDDLRAVKETFAIEDEFQLLEAAAPRVNFVLRNLSDRPRKGIMLRLRIQRIPGFELAPCVYTTLIDEVTRRRVLKDTGNPLYPAIQRHDDAFEVSQSIAEIEENSETEVFGEALRVVVRTPAENQQVLVSYELESDSLDATIKGTLELTLLPAAQD